MTMLERLKKVTKDAITGAADQLMRFASTEGGKKFVDKVAEAAGEIASEKIKQPKTKLFGAGLADEASMMETYGNLFSKLLNELSEAKVRALVFRYCNWINDLVDGDDPELKWRAEDLHEVITKLGTEQQQAAAFLPFLICDDEAERTALLKQSMPKKPLTKKVAGMAVKVFDESLHHIGLLSAKTLHLAKNEGVDLLKLGVDAILNYTIPAIVAKSTDLNKSAREFNRKDRQKLGLD